jgi:replicative DNA helicase
MTEEIKTLPHDLESEEGLIATCLLDRNSLIAAIEAGVHSDSFFKEGHKVLWQGLMELSARDGLQEINEVELLDLLRKKGLEEDVGGIAGIYLIQSRVETPAHAHFFTTKVLETFDRRRIIRTARETIEDAFNPSKENSEILHDTEKSLKEIAESCQNKSTVQTSSEVVFQCLSELNERLTNPTLAQAKAQTPLFDLNEVLPRNGFLPGQLIILAARPSLGKTSLAMNIAEKVTVDDGTPALVFSLEMGSIELINRVACARARVNSKALDDGTVRPGDQKRLAHAFEEIKEAPLLICDDRTVNVMTLSAKARHTASQLERQGKKLGLIVLDYLQLMPATDSRASREQNVSEMSRSLKLLAGELDVPVLALSQLNRQSERDSRKPRISDLRESGAIEQDADIVLLLHRPDQSQYNNGVYPDPNVEVLNIIHAKVRNGPVGEVNATFRRSYTRFENYMAERKATAPTTSSESVDFQSLERQYAKQ